MAHYCKLHKTPWFKKGKMRGYAHPIEDTGEWCNEPEEDTPEDTPPAKEIAKPISTSETVKPQMSREDWAEKDKITRKSIERQKSVECAVMLCQSAQIKPDEILTYAKTFEEFISRAL